MNNKSIFKAVFLLAVTAVFFASCDKDFNEIGTDVIGGDHFLFERYEGQSLVAYSHGTGVVQTNNLAENPIGVIDNPAFGKTISSFVTQVQLASTSPTFGANLEIDSVYLYVPYNSTKGSDGLYTLKDIYPANPDPDAKIKLSIFESGYYLNEFDPATGSTEAQRFYNDDALRFENNKRGTVSETDGTSIPNGDRLNRYSASENDSFAFSNKEIRTDTRNDDNELVTTKAAPGMRIKLNKNFFMKKIIQAPADKLESNSAFKQYFRGLYFKTEEVPGSKNMYGSMNFAKGTITIYYKEDKVVGSGSTAVTTRVKKTCALNLTGSTVSLQQHISNGTDAAYVGSLASNEPESAMGDSKLYLKGGEGSMAIIKLFSNHAELDTLRARHWLINEANLTFTIDHTGNQPYIDPERIYLYDLDNKRPIYDYTTDVSVATDPKRNKGVFGGLVVRDTSVVNEPGVKYKIRLTNHLRNLLNARGTNTDTTNVRLGLVITDNIAITSNVFLKAPNANFDRIPTASVMNPFGTILYGTNLPADDPKRLKLEIFYTKDTTQPNN